MYAVAAPIIVGSSPHTRGAPQIVQDRTTSIGIIPAYAGSTGTLPIANGGTGDHPRIRGEHVRPARRGSFG